MDRSSQQMCSMKKKTFLKISQNSQENICARICAACNFIKKETLAQVFFCEFFEISKNTSFTKHLRTTASRWKKEMQEYHYLDK